MPYYEKIMLALYLIALIIIVVEVSVFWGIAITMMLILIVTVLQKMDTEEKIENIENSRERLLDLISEKLDNFSNRLLELRQNLNKHVFVLESRVDEVKHHSDLEMERNYRELARKIFEIENKLNSVKKTLGAAFGSLDERLKKFEKEEEWTG